MEREDGGKKLRDVIRTAQARGAMIDGDGDKKMTCFLQPAQVCGCVCVGTH